MADNLVEFIEVYTLIDELSCVELSLGAGVVESVIWV